MVNVNVQLPPVIAMPIPQATEALHRENLLQTAIPKTEQAKAYTKMRDKKEKEQVAHQFGEIIQDGDSDGDEEYQLQDSYGNPNKRRENFFAAKFKLSPQEVESLPVALAEILDYKSVMSVIQGKYHAAVSPIPQPTVSYDI